jgi:MFS family permease|tara:strand:+ start:111 stop:1394 length:1284 start_codon:yes stop_codon:yes gene_type:complete
MAQSVKKPNIPCEINSDQTPSKKRRFSNILDALSYRDFRWLWIGSFVSFMAMNMQMITRSWLILRVTDDSPLALTLVTLTFALPMTVVAPFAGALADRFSRKKLIVFSQIGSGILTLILGTLDLTGIVTFWHIMVIGIFNGSLMSINMPSRQAIISDIVPDSKLMNAISLSNSSMNLTRVAGPALAGFLILLLDTAGVFFVISIIYAFAAVTIGMVHYAPNRVAKTGKNVGRDVGDGIRYAFANPVLRGLFIMSFIPVLFGFSYMVLVPAWAREALAIESDGLGILLMLMGIGATIGTLLLSVMGNIPRRGMVMLCASLAWGVALAVFAQVTSFSMAVPFLIFIGFTSSMYMSLNMTMVQLKADPEMRGRTMSISMMTFGMMPLSAVPFGTLAEKIGTADSLTISGILLAVFTIGFAIANKTFRKMD